MGPRLAGLGIGVAFGVVLSWSGMTSPEVIRGALLFEEAYLFLFFASAVLVSTLGLALLRRAGTRALLTGAPVSWAKEPVERRHIYGSLVFGIGWGISDACPGPIMTQVGQGIGWGLFLLLGVVIGVYAFLRRHEDSEPAAERRTGPRLRVGLEPRSHPRG
ncbi:MAG: YeeE/YedE family protein [Thermoleophilaceae bacterium]|nr:YeeE/YedE family protein [Thermoleophilaceae bacterium]